MSSWNTWLRLISVAKRCSQQLWTPQTSSTQCFLRLFEEKVARRKWSEILSALTPLQPGEGSTWFIYLLHLAGGAAVTEAEQNTEDVNQTEIRHNGRRQERLQAFFLSKAFVTCCRQNPESQTFYKSKKLDCHLYRGIDKGYCNYDFWNSF